MLHIHPDRPLGLLLLALIQTLDRIATELHIPYFVIGATARDILMEHVYALETTRATRDIDFAVAVPSWEAFAELKTHLIATGAFLQGEAPHRLQFCEGAGAYPLDLVPFDGVEHEGEIAWPPDGDFVMNIAGYADAQDSALLVEIAPGFAVKIVSMPAMAILKILAWQDRPDGDKHASDVMLLLRHYYEAGQFDRLYADGAELLAVVDYDLELAGAALLGRDARRDVTPDTFIQASNALADERKIDRFIAQAKRSTTMQTERATRLLGAFLNALRS